MDRSWASVNSAYLIKTMQLLSGKTCNVLLGGTSNTKELTENCFLLFLNSRLACHQILSQKQQSVTEGASVRKWAGLGALF